MDRTEGKLEMSPVRHPITLSIDR